LGSPQDELEGEDDGDEDDDHPLRFSASFWLLDTQKRNKPVACKKEKATIVEPLLIEDSSPEADAIVFLDDTAGGSEEGKEDFFSREQSSTQQPQLVSPSLRKNSSGGEGCSGSPWIKRKRSSAEEEEEKGGSDKENNAGVLTKRQLQCANGSKIRSLSLAVRRAEKVVPTTEASSSLDRTDVVRSSGLAFPRSDHRQEERKHGMLESDGTEIELNLAGSGQNVRRGLQQKSKTPTFSSPSSSCPKIIAPFTEADVKKWHVFLLSSCSLLRPT